MHGGLFGWFKKKKDTVPITTLPASTQIISSPIQPVKENTFIITQSNPTPVQTVMVIPSKVTQNPYAQPQAQPQAGVASDKNNEPRGIKMNPKDPRTKAFLKEVNRRNKKNAAKGPLVFK